MQFNIKKEKIYYKINKQNNSTNGYFDYSGNKYFFKLVDRENYDDELYGYRLLNGKIPVKKIIYHSFYKEDKYIIIYEYEDSIKQDQGLLNDLLVEYDQKRISIDTNNKIKQLIAVHNLFFCDIKNTNNSRNKKFYNDRIETRLKKWYNNNQDFSKEVIINKINSITTRKIINETEEYFKQKLC